MSLDPNVVNEKIHELERKRDQLHHSLNDTSKFAEKAHDLASLLSVAIKNNDLNTINVLIQSNGGIPSLLKAQELMTRKLHLLNDLRLNGIKNDIMSRLNITTFDLNLMKSIKDDIANIDDLELKRELNSCFSDLIQVLKKPLYSEFNELLLKSQWLKKNSISSELNDLFINLINLQSLTEFRYPDSLWAFDLIAKSFKISFDYHFNSNKNLVSIDKPELFFNYYLNYLNLNLIKISKIWNLSKTELSLSFAHSEFITSSIKPVNSKLLQYLDILTDKNDEDSLELLTHLINETIQFDSKLIDEFYYDPLNDSLWVGLFNNFTFNHLESLLVRDVKLYSNQFENILNQSNNFQIDYTSVNDQDLKPTISSLKLKILIENLTFKNFSKFFKINYESNTSLIKFKLKIFSKIYLSLLQSYLEVLDDGYDAFNDLLKSTKNLINSNSSQEIDISNIKGLERIFRLYCSLKFISNCLNQWNQEFIFIELNELFNSHSVDEKSLSLFDLILSDYNVLELKIWSLLKKFLSISIDQSFKNYLNLNIWNSLSDSSIVKPSNELQLPIQLINSYLEFINRILPNFELVKLKQFMINEIICIYINKIIKSNHLNSIGVFKLNIDVEFLLKNLNLLNFTSFQNFHKFNEFLKILKLSNNDRELNCLNGLNLNQFAKAGQFSEFKSELQLIYLNDSEILDVLLRIHI